MMNWLNNPAPALPARPLTQPKAAGLLQMPSRSLRHLAARDLSDGCWREAMHAAGLSSLLQSSGKLELLVPSDRAFTDLLHELKLSWSELCADLPGLRRLLLGHLLMDGAALAMPSARPGALLRTAGQGIVQLLGEGRLRDALGRQAQILGVIAPQQGLKPLAHLIDRVLRPAERGLLDLLADSSTHSDFLGALRSTGLSTWLSGRGPFTVLAPSNAGFAHAGARLGLRQGQLLSQQPELLKALLARHLVPGRWLSDEMPWGGQLVDVSGAGLSLSALGQLGSGDSAQGLLKGSDRLASNGVMHRLHQPLLPSP